MNKLNRVMALAGASVLMSLGTSNLRAQDQPRQGRGNPEEMRQRMIDGMRERLEVKSDDEWKIISERINKVMEARRQVGFGGGPGGFGFGRVGRPGADANTPPAGANDQGGRRGQRGFGEPSPEADALQKAIESKASAEELKAKLAKFPMLGATETIFMVLSNRPGRVRPGSAGTPVPGTEARLLDAAGREVPGGVEGVLHVRTPSLSPSYWRPRRTIATS